MKNELELMKKHIASEFIKIVENSNSANITVTAIVKACEISRGTFYYHFADIRDLSIWIFRSELTHYLLKRIPEEKLIFSFSSKEDKYHTYPFYMNTRTLEDNLNLTPFWYSLFDYLISRKKYYKKIFLNRQQFDMKKYIFDLYADEFNNDITFYLNGRQLKPSVKQFLKSFYINAIFGWYISICTEDLIIYDYEKKGYLPEINNLAIESLKFEIDKIINEKLC